MAAKPPVGAALHVGITGGAVAAPMTPGTVGATAGIKLDGKMVAFAANNAKATKPSLSSVGKGVSLGSGVLVIVGVGVSVMVVLGVTVGVSDTRTVGEGVIVSVAVGLAVAVAVDVTDSVAVRVGKAATVGNSPTVWG